MKLTAKIKAILPQRLSDEALDEIFGNWLPGIIAVLFVFAFVVGMVG